MTSLNRNPTRRACLGLVSASALILGACTQPLSTEQANALRSSTDKASSALTLPASLQVQAHNAATNADNLCRYLDGQRTYSLGKKHAPVDVGPSAKDQAVLGKALQGYLTALIDASTGASIQKLETAKTAFLTQLATVTATQPAVAPIASSVIGILGRINEAQRQSAIRQIMLDVGNSLETVPLLLKGERELVLQDVESQIVRYEQQARCVLRHQRSKTTAPQDYSNFDDEIRALREQTSIIAAGPELMKKLIDVHFDVAQEKTSFADGFAQLADLLENLNSLQTQLK